MMMAQQQLLQRRQVAHHSTGLSHSSRAGRRTAVIVQANKLIKGGNRPRESGKGGAGGSSSKQSRSIELNLQRLATDPEFLPERAIGPAELASNIPGGCDGARATFGEATWSLLLTCATLSPPPALKTWRAP